MTRPFHVLSGCCLSYDQLRLNKTVLRLKNTRRIVLPGPYLAVQNSHCFSYDQIDLLSDAAEGEDRFLCSGRIIKSDDAEIVRQAAVLPEQEVKHYIRSDIVAAENPLFLSIVAIADAIQRMF